MCSKKSEFEPTYKQLANLEVPPDAELVIHVDLTDRNPLMVRSDTCQLAVCKARSGGREAASESRVIAVSSTCLPRLVRDFMIILYGQVNKIYHAIRIVDVP